MALNAPLILRQGPGSALRELAARGAHRLPIPDVLIAACAQQHGLGVLHLDRHFDLLSEHLGLPAVSLRDLR